MEPLVIKKVTTATGEVVRESAPRVRRRVVPRSVAAALAEMLVAVTEGEGTGVEAAIDGYQVAGKTATAQKTDPATGRYSLDKFIGSFVGFVPAKKPVVAIAVMLDEPMVEHAGGAVAAPIFRRVAQMSLKYMGLTPKGKESVDIAELALQPDPASATYALLRQAQGKKPPVQSSVSHGKLSAGQVRMPDMTGWPVREALRRAFELGVNPKVQGTGLLAGQTPPPGEALEKGAAVTLVFEPAT
jgi:cell division protein FtsI (penicillin-binding protein 3)